MFSSSQPGQLLEELTSRIEHEAQYLTSNRHASHQPSPVFKQSDAYNGTDDGNLS